MKIKILKGQVILNHCWKQINTPNCKVIQFDCTTKYGEVDCTGSSSDKDGVEYDSVFLGINDSTLYTSLLKDCPTEIRFYRNSKDKKKEFHILAEYSKYTLTVVIFNQKVVNYRSPTVKCNSTFEL